MGIRNNIPGQHPDCAAPKWPNRVIDKLHNWSFILCWKKSPVIAVFWILGPPVTQFSYPVWALMQLQCRIPPCLHIQNSKYCILYFGCCTINNHILTTRCQHNKYIKHSLQYKGWFQHLQNCFHYVLCQLSSLNLVLWQAVCWFYHFPTFKVFNISQYLCFWFVQVADLAHGLCKTRCGHLHRLYWWMHLHQVEWCAPYMVWRYSMQVTQ